MLVGCGVKYHLGLISGKCRLQFGPVFDIQQFGMKLGFLRFLAKSSCSMSKRLFSQLSIIISLSG
jgi:hypothetical protein